MPIVTRSAPAAAVVAADDEVLAAAQRHARAGDMAAAWSAFAPVEDRARRIGLVSRVTANLAAESPAGAAAFASAGTGGQAQTTAIEVAARAWVQRDDGAALRWAHAATDPAEATTVRRAVAEALVAADARTAIDRVGALPAGRGRDEMLLATATAWARQNPDEALAWLRSRPDDELKPRVTSAVGFEVAQRNPSQAIAVAESLPADRNRWLLLAAIGQTWVAVDAKAAVAWASKLPAGEPRDAAFAGIETGYGIRVARRNPGAPNTRSGVRNRGGGTAVSAWPEVSSPDFAAWLALQPPGLSREDAILEYVRQRGALQPDVVGQWLANLPGSAARDRALEIFVDGLLIGSPADAANWIRSLPRSDRSDLLIERTARRWLMTNPDAAAAWLLETPLPPYRREQLLREAGR